MKISIYARVSTEEQKEGKTIESQVKDLRGYAKDKSYEIVSEHFDDGWTGSILERPELDKLRDEAKNGKFEAVLIHHPDRLSRVQLHQLLLLDEFERENIKAFFYKLPEFSEQSEEGRVVNKSVWSMVSELERLRIRERTRRGKRNKAEKGIVVGHKAPYGYRYIKATVGSREGGRYVINPSEAKAVKIIFSLAKQGSSMRDIVRKLAELKLPRRYAPKDLKRPIWGWTLSTIHKILTNETYTGITYYNKYESVEAKNPTSTEKYKRISKTSRKLRARDKWIPISLPLELQLVSKGDFEFVRSQLIRNKSYSIRNTKYQYLLRGLLRCGNCGYKYHADCSHDKAIYRDSNKSSKFPMPRTCEAGQVGANIIEPLVWNAVTEAILKPELILKEAEIYDRENKYSSNGDQVKSSLDKLKTQEQRLLEGYREGAIELSQLKIQMSQIKLQRSGLESDRVEAKRPAISLLSRGVKKLCKQLKKVVITMTFEDKQKFLRLILDEVVIQNNKITIKGILPIPTKIEPNLSFASPTSL
jgi:site-specific DNA recombinase